ncbi:unnamed protein product [Rotaria sp. Silwood1]|nr:unnamed protein product [Rotaria sp. Silwood1]
MYIVESFLSLLPNLTHLRLMSETAIWELSLFDGSLWENFIEMKLPLLNKFEFWFTRPVYDHAEPNTVESLIAPFQTPFWLEIKRWLVKCDYVDDDYGRKFHLYSIPIFLDSFDYSSQQGTILHSKLNIMDNNAPIIVNAHRLDLNLSQIMTENIQNNVSLIIPLILL